MHAATEVGATKKIANVVDLLARIRPSQDVGIHTLKLCRAKSERVVTADIGEQITRWIIALKLKPVIGVSNRVNLDGVGNGYSVCSDNGAACCIKRPNRDAIIARITDECIATKDLPAIELHKQHRVEHDEYNC